MKICLIGGFNLAETLLVITKGFRAEGHEVDNLYERALFVSGGLDEAIEEVSKKQYDLVFLWNVKEKAFLPHIETLRKLKCPIIFYTFDDPWYSDYQNPVIPYHCDYIFTSCEDSAEGYRKRGKKASVLYPPVDEVIHTRMPTGDYVCDFSFVAFTIYHKSSYKDVPIQRADLIRRLRKEYPRAQIRLYGLWDGAQHWGDEIAGCPEERHSYVKRTVYEENPLVYFNSKMNFNTHLQSYRKGYYNQRQIDILGSGGFLLCDKVNGIEEVFRQGWHLDWFENIEEMIEKVKHYFLYPRLIPKIAQNGFEYVHKYFNSRVFARKVVECLKKI